MKIILTGTTGFVGEGILLECLKDERVEKVGWLRGIHHHCSKERLQGYLDEYHFRFNRRASKDTIFDVLIRRMMFYEPKRLK